MPTIRVEIDRAGGIDISCNGERITITSKQFEAVRDAVFMNIIGPHCTDFFVGTDGSTDEVL